jgi:predicted Na+-dependent transporter
MTATILAGPWLTQAPAAGDLGSDISASQWLSLAINVVLPIVVALVTSRVAGGAVKALVLLVLSAISSYLVAILASVEAGTAVDWSQTTFTALVGLVVAVSTHFGVWKPTGVTGSDGLVQRKVSAGIGGRRAA